MGREVRRVPSDWQHPKETRWNSLTRQYEEVYKPLFDQDYATAAREWLDNCLVWEAGTHKDFTKYSDVSKARYPFYWDWAGMPPEERYYRPAWKPEERTHYQMYENTSEGTPISPVMATREELARWLADNGASFFGGSTTSYEHWLCIINGTAIGLPVFRVKPTPENQTP